jgi:HlyD family secretion protein
MSIPGQTVAASLQAPVLFTIAEDLKQMELQVDVDEADVGRTVIGQKATFSVDAYPGRRFPAEIRDIRFMPETVQGVVTYKAMLIIDNSELLLRPGMTATAEIVVQEVEDACWCPMRRCALPPPRTTRTPQTVSLLQRIIPSPPRFRPASRPADGRSGSYGVGAARRRSNRRAGRHGRQRWPLDRDCRGRHRER